MKVIAIAAVTAGGKTTIVNEIKRILPEAKSLHFDNYLFDGVVEDYYRWTSDGADYNVWDLSPLEKDINTLRKDNSCEYLLLDYPFAYCHDRIRDYIDVAIFIDTPLDIAMARRVLRDFKDATAEEICDGMKRYLKYERIAYVQLQTDILPSSDHVIDGTKELDEIVCEILKIISEH